MLGLSSSMESSSSGQVKMGVQVVRSIKKTWKPQSYHPSAIWVFDPIFSSTIACFHITFQSQGEEMMNGGLCGEGVLGLAQSQWLVR